MLYLECCLTTKVHKTSIKGSIKAAYCSCKFCVVNVVFQVVAAGVRWLLRCCYVFYVISVCFGAGSDRVVLDVYYDISLLLGVSRFL